ncbi:MAG TPA: deaminase [Acetobacteraceae bacterium]|nr:deaminase [Acetobacteraceae bacterium]
MTVEVFMRRAIALSCEQVEAGGGPFGAVIVRNGEIIAEGANEVTLANDPTAHAEVVAIRRAAQALGTFDLSGCTLFTSCEPCPMCLGATYWARIDQLFYGNDRRDAAGIGFDDEFIYREVVLPPVARSLKMTRLLPDEAQAAFDAWCKSPDKVSY